ncbi:hypothetical protein [Streptomyces silaceus]|uniref:hypothetical protein n=1 Tax=Streptomyces silaceus TaxID=545123 RepID=UPI0006EBAFAD|nr:hypothetical protein [Streptomyces silaceus]
MPERTDHLPEQPSPAQPVATDPQADAPELLRRAAADYTSTQAHHAEVDHEDRVHGMEMNR